MQDLPERQRSMRAVFEYSWKLMSPREQAIFPKLSVFCGGFSHQAAKKILGITPRDLMGLVNKSLIQRPLEGRFYLHPILRQYATEILDKLDSCQAVHDAHCAYFAKVLHDLGESMFDQRQAQAFILFAGAIGVRIETGQKSGQSLRAQCPFRFGDRHSVHTDSL